MTEHSAGHRQHRRLRLGHWRVEEFARLLADPEVAIFSLTITGAASAGAGDPDARGDRHRARGPAPGRRSAAHDPQLRQPAWKRNDAGAADQTVCQSRSAEHAATSRRPAPSRTRWSTGSRRRPRRRSGLALTSSRDRRSWPVVAEPFRQWVIEDGFAAGRPDYETSARCSPTASTTGSSTSYGCSTPAIRAWPTSPRWPDSRLRRRGDRRAAVRSSSSASSPRGDPVARPIPGHPAEDYARRSCALRQHRRARPDRPALHRRTAKFPTFLIRRSTPARARRPDSSRGPGPRRVGALSSRDAGRRARARSSWGARNRTCARVARRTADLPRPRRSFLAPLRESERFRVAFSDASRNLAADGSLGAIERLLA